MIYIGTTNKDEKIYKSRKVNSTIFSYYKRTSKTNELVRVTANYVKMNLKE